MHHAARGVDLLHRRVGVQPDALATPQLRLTQEQVLGVPAGEERGQRNPVVRRARLLREHLDAPLL
jgi:hypothetical protein